MSEQKIQINRDRSMDHVTVQLDMNFLNKLAISADSYNHI